jgi:hypothetical protein
MVVKSLKLTCNDAYLSFKNVSLCGLHAKKSNKNKLWCVIRNAEVILNEDAERLN